jgi:hypothetical protein
LALLNGIVSVDEVAAAYVLSAAIVAETVQLPEAPVALRVFPVNEQPEFTVYVIAPEPDIPEVVSVAVSS